MQPATTVSAAPAHTHSAVALAARWRSRLLLQPLFNLLNDISVANELVNDNGLDNVLKQAANLFDTLSALQCETVSSRIVMDYDSYVNSSLNSDNSIYNVTMYMTLKIRSLLAVTHRLSLDNYSYVSTVVYL